MQNTYSVLAPIAERNLTRLLLDERPDVYWPPTKWLLEMIDGKPVQRLANADGKNLDLAPKQLILMLADPEARAALSALARSTLALPAGVVDGEAREIEGES